MFGTQIGAQWPAVANVFSVEPHLQIFEKDTVSSKHDITLAVESQMIPYFFKVVSQLNIDLHRINSITVRTPLRHSLSFAEGESESVQTLAYSVTSKFV